MHNQFLARAAGFSHPRRSGLALTGLLLLASTSATAGTWGQGRWGQMYWGSNPETAPVSVPVVNTVTEDGNDIVVVVEDYPVGSGADGWLRATSFEVTCSNGTVQMVTASSAGEIRIPDLEPNTDYQCTIQAFNELGGSPSALRLATTGAALGGGLSIPVLNAAICRGANQPAFCGNP